MTRSWCGAWAWCRQSSWRKCCLSRVLKRPVGVSSGEGLRGIAYGCGRLMYGGGGHRRALGESEPREGEADCLTLAWTTLQEHSASFLHLASLYVQKTLRLLLGGRGVQSPGSGAGLQILGGAQASGACRWRQPPRPVPSAKYGHQGSGRPGTQAEWQTARARPLLAPPSPASCPLTRERRPAIVPNRPAATSAPRVTWPCR